jgi:hypothetical protein
MGESKKKKSKLIIAKDMDEVEAKLKSRELPEVNGDNPNMWVFEHAFPLADRIAIPMKELFDKYDDAPEDKSEADILIARTLSLMLVISFMNFSILDTDNLDKAFATVKKMAKDYVDVLNGGKIN